MAKVGKKKNGYKMPDPLPNGEILTDTTKNQWKLGPSIGKGGFGEIYSATKVETDNSNIKYVIKIEPHDNGPLFVEMHFYKRNCKSADIDAFKQEKKLDSLGVPVFIASGSHEHNKQKYRFIVIEEYGTDIWKLFLANKRAFPQETVFKLAIQIINILEYIHSKGYVHADIKGSNLLLGSRKENENQVFLLDFGLASHYFSRGVFKPDPKKAHNGTIEYLSVDAHLGVQTRRGDIEILLYNLIQWLGHTLPWENNLSDIKYVHESKENHLKNIPEFVATCFENEKVPDSIVKSLTYLSTLKFNTEPDYDKLKSFFLNDLKSLKAGTDLKLIFKQSATKKRKNSPVKLPAEISKSKKVTKTATNDAATIDETPTSEMLKYEKKLEEKQKKNSALKKRAVASSMEELSTATTSRCLRQKPIVSYVE